MKVFISWSGDRSRKVGELLDEWLQCVIQAIDPWMSSKHIDRGTLWFNEINNQLKDTGLGIVCLTKENKNKPWILFESGALSKGLTSSRVFTFLVDLNPEDISDPLGQFNHTMPTKVGLKQLVNTLNNILDEQSLKESVLNQVFNTYWTQFESKFNNIISTTKESEVVDERTENDILLDILSATRNLDRRIRSIESERYLLNDDNIRNRVIRKDNEVPANLDLKSYIKEALMIGKSPDAVMRSASVRFPNRSSERIKMYINKFIQDERNIIEGSGN